jgi:hypothetical protein
MTIPQSTESAIGASLQQAQPAGGYTELRLLPPFITRQCSLQARRFDSDGLMAAVSRAAA